MRSRPKKDAAIEAFESGAPSAHASKQHDVKTTKQQTGRKAPLELSEKLMMYLTPETRRSLEKAWFELRQDSQSPGQVSRTLVTELALRQALRDFEERGQDSDLARDLQELLGR